MKYDIKYEHLWDEMVTSSDLRFYFHYVRDSANQYELELTDQEFRYFFKLEIHDVDIKWIMSYMKHNETSFTDALVACVTY